MIADFGSWFNQQGKGETEEVDGLIECCRCRNYVEYIGEPEDYAAFVLNDDYYCGGSPRCCP